MIRIPILFTFLTLIHAQNNTNSTTIPYYNTVKRSPSPGNSPIHHPIQLFDINPRIGPNGGAFKVNITGYGFFEPDLAFIFKFHSGDSKHGEHEVSKEVNLDPVANINSTARSHGKMELELPKFPEGTTYVLIAAKASTHDEPSDPILLRTYSSKLVVADLLPQPTFFLSKPNQRLVLSGTGFPLSDRYWVAFTGQSHHSTQTLRKVTEASYVRDSTIACTVPSWPQAGEVHVELSFNGQHFHSVRMGGIVYEEESTMFGGLANVDEDDNDVTIESNEQEHVRVDEEGNVWTMAAASDNTAFTSDDRLIHDIFIVFCFAAIGGLIVGVLGFPLILGFVLGGCVCGPGMLNLLTELVQVDTFSELGVCFFLFCLGLEMTLSTAKRSLKVVLYGGFGAMLANVFIQLAFATFRGSPYGEAVFIGCFASMSSTVIAARKMNDMHEDEEKEATFAVLVTQDLILGMLLVVPKIESVSIGWMALSLLGVPPLLFVLAKYVLPYLFLRIKGGQAESGLAIAVTCLVFAVAYACERAHLSIESSSFVLGCALALLPPHLLLSVKTVIAPIREFFIVLFFAAMGMLIRPSFILANVDHILIAFWLICMVKFVIMVPCLILARKNVGVAVRVSLGLAHVGEFGFILAAKGSEMQVISRHVYLLLIGVTAVSLVLTPLFLRVLDKLTPKGGERNIPRTVQSPAFVEGQEMSTAVTRFGMKNAEESPRRRRGSGSGLPNV